MLPLDWAWLLNQTTEERHTWLPISLLPYMIYSMTYCCWAHSDRKRGRLASIWMILTIAIFPFPPLHYLTYSSFMLKAEAMLQGEDNSRQDQDWPPVWGLKCGRQLLAIKMSSQQGVLCHLCCSPGRKEECGRQSGSHQSFQYGMSPTYDHWGLVVTHGCCTERLAVL